MNKLPTCEVVDMNTRRRIAHGETSEAAPAWDESINAEYFSQLKDRLTELADQLRAASPSTAPAVTSVGMHVIVPLQTMAPERLNLKKPILVLVYAENEGFIASFVDAQISASGDTIPEAVGNLKTLLAHLWEVYEHRDRLGPGPLRSMEVLREFLAPSD